jgi:putative transposase
MSSRYSKNAGALFSLKYHIVWCPKYRRRVLEGPVEERFRALVAEVARELDAKIHALEIMPDHVHLFIESDPRWPVAGIVDRIKGRTSRILRQEFPSLRSRLPTLWSRSYFAATVGSVTALAVQRYIESQKAP